MYSPTVKCEIYTVIDDSGVQDCNAVTSSSSTEGTPQPFKMKAVHLFEA
jgi:hypothetical protein